MMGRESAGVCVGKGAALRGRHYPPPPTRWSCWQAAPLLLVYIATSRCCSCPDGSIGNPTTLRGGLPCPRALAVSVGKVVGHHHLGSCLPTVPSQASCLGEWRKCGGCLASGVLLGTWSGLGTLRLAGLLGPLSRGLALLLDLSCPNEAARLCKGRETCATTLGYHMYAEIPPAHTRHQSHLHNIYRLAQPDSDQHHATGWQPFVVGRCLHAVRFRKRAVPFLPTPIPASGRAFSQAPGSSACGSRAP